jgi:hypothetical protein
VALGRAVAAEGAVALREGGDQALVWAASMNALR